MTKRTLLVCLAVTVLLALTAGVALAKTIQGTNGPDNLDGTPRADEISGRDGNDDIEGRNGDDRLLGGGGRDQVSGGYGSDTAYGLAGNDTVAGGRGPKDRVVGGDGADQLIGEEMAGNAGDDKIGDPFNMYAGSREPLGYYGSYGITVADGGDGDDRINVVDDPDYPHTPDVVRCGPGAADEVKADPDDDVARDCETVELVGNP